MGDDFFIKAGGHKMAAGFSVRMEKIDELKLDKGIKQLYKSNLLKFK